MLKLETIPYSLQAPGLPQTGRHILAQFDHDSVVVYQAYDQKIAGYALRHGAFGGEFSFTRMSWIKPGFLWMMHRSGWGTKEGQQVVLAIRLRRSAFDTILREAVPSTYDPQLFASPELFRQATVDSQVRVQWDPDYGPGDERLERRAIQLGLRGETLRRYATEWIIEIHDLTEFVSKQRECVLAGAYQNLIVPREQVYPFIP